LADPTTISILLDGDQVEGIRELYESELSATFDEEFNLPRFDPTTISFTGQANERLLELWNGLPSEGPDFVPLVSDGTLVFEKKYFVDLRSLVFFSDVESQAGIREDNVFTFIDDAESLTILLMQSEGLWTNADRVKIPYIVENRKRLLEFMQLQQAIIVVSKSIYDEVFKMVNITSDMFSGYWFTTVGALAVAISNLISTLINLVILTIQLVKLLIDLFKLIFPPIRYHFGINLYNWLRKGTEKLGYTLEVGDDYQKVLEQINICPSKSDEVGPPAIFFELPESIAPTINAGDGLLRPKDFGYTLGQAIRGTKLLHKTKVAVIDNVVHLRPKNDPFWQNGAVYNLPDVLIEQAMDYQNGTSRPDYDSMWTRTLIEYQEDPSDLHTLTDSNNRVAEFIYSPITIENQKRVNLKGIDDNQIPWALCVPKPKKDNLISNKIDLEELFDTMQGIIDSLFENNPVLSLESSEGPPNLEELASLIFIKKGALLVENHFFSVAKLVVLEEDKNGILRIPDNYTEIVGADALFNNYHSYDANVPGFREGDETNQKIIHENVRVPFGIEDWNGLKENSWFNSPFGKAQMRQVKWKITEDFATIDFHTFTTWNKNLQGKLFKIGPTNALVPAT